MKISNVKDLLDAELVCGGELLCEEVEKACGSDLMSDVLAFDTGHGLLVTGLVNPQVIRTAEMMDMKCIVFARGKQPSIDMITMAQERDIVLLRVSTGMLSTCGKLYSAGIREEV